MRLSLAAIGAGLGIAVAVASVAYEFIAANRLRALRKREQRAPRRGTPTVTILKPLAGIEAGLYENLCSFVDQRYPRLQVIFGVADAADPAVDIVTRVIARFPDADVSLVVGDGSVNGNPKVANLAAMMPRVKGDVLVVADADMRVDANYLDAVVSAFDDPQVGAVTCLYCGEPADGLASKLGAAYINEQFAPSVLVASLTEPLTYCFGSTMGVRRTVLDEIGGLEALGGHIGDDYLLGRLVSERGYRVALAPYVVRNIVYERDLRSLLEHELRWARTIRVQRPLGYASLFVTQPLFCALVLLVVTKGSQAGWIAFGAALASRATLFAEAARTFPGAKTPPWMLAVRDALTAAVWIGGFFVRGVRWRERVYAVDDDGRVATSLQQIRQNSPTRCKT